MILKSKCCGFGWYKEWIPPERSTAYPHGYYQIKCFMCGKPTELEEKTKEVIKNVDKTKNS